MFHSKTEEYEARDNDCHASFFQHPTLANFHSTEVALSKAMENITELQENLSFMISLNDELRAENKRLRDSQQKVTMQANLEINKREREIEQHKQANKQIEDLLEQLRISLTETEEELVQRIEENERYERKIQEQKKAYSELENNFMNQSMSCMNIGDTSSMYGNCGYIAELEKQNDQLQQSLKRLRQQSEKSESKHKKAEKEVMEYKRWMASLLGMQKIVEGTESIIMNQISHRIIPA